MRLSAFARAKPGIASSSLTTLTNLCHETGLDSRLRGIAYEHTSRIQPGTSLLQNRPGGWSQYLLSRSRACQRPGHSSASRRSNIFPDVSTDVRVVAQRQVPPDRPRLPGLRPLFLAEPERVQLHLRPSGSSDGGLRQSTRTGPLYPFSP